MYNIYIPQPFSNGRIYSSSICYQPQAIGERMHLSRSKHYFSRPSCYWNSEHKHRRKTCQCWQWPNVGKSTRDCRTAWNAHNASQDNVALLGRIFKGKFHKETLWWETNWKYFGIRKPKNRVKKPWTRCGYKPGDEKDSCIFTLNLIGWNRNKQPKQRL